MRRLKTLDADIIIIGAGLAGLTAALTASREGRRVAIVSEPQVLSASERSGGNFRASVPTYTAERHFLDTLSAGHYLSQRSLAKALAENASWAQAFLGGLGLKVEPGEHGFQVAGGECPGEVLVGVLRKAVQAKGISLVPGFGWTVLVDGEGRARGALVFDGPKGEWLALAARAVILATGGAAGAYLRTDNDPEATGDGLAMAFRAGAALADMEFVQFWPLATLGEGASTYLPWSALEGKRLLVDGGRDIAGKVGLEDLAKGRADAPDVARRIYQETVWGLENSAPEPGLTLVGGSGQAAPVSPAAHHTIGGVVCGDHGQTRVEGLFAAGEIVAGMHGADRLSGNGLSEAAVMGKRAATLASSLISDEAAGPVREGEAQALAQEEIRRTMAQFGGAGSAGARPLEVIGRVREAMWRCVGPVRNRDGLDTAQSTLNKIKRMAPLAVDLADGEATRTGLKALNLMAVAEAITRSARYRRESRGVHFRADYPEKDDAEWLRHVRVKLLHGEMSLDISQGLELMGP